MSRPVGGTLPNRVRGVPLFDPVVDELAVDYACVGQFGAAQLTRRERTATVARLTTGSRLSANAIARQTRMSRRSVQRHRAWAGVTVQLQQPTPEALAEREEVHRLKAEGLRLQTIADRLDITLRRVKHHLYGGLRPAQQQAA